MPTTESITPTSTTPRLTQRQADAFCWLLLRIANWTPARWDQHLRDEVGDEDTNAIIAAVKNIFGDPVEVGNRPAKIRCADPEDFSRMATSDALYTWSEDRERLQAEVADLTQRLSDMKDLCVAQAGHINTLLKNIFTSDAEPKGMRALTFSVRLLLESNGYTVPPDQSPRIVLEEIINQKKRLEAALQDAEAQLAARPVAVPVEVQAVVDAAKAWATSDFDHPSKAYWESCDVLLEKIRALPSAGLMRVVSGWADSTAVLDHRLWGSFVVCENKNLARAVSVTLCWRDEPGKESAP
jgi:hypothetical protein